MSSITYQRDPILDESDEATRTTGRWAGVLITILTLLVLSSLVRMS
jgi:hypothetical protein